MARPTPAAGKHIPPSREDAKLSSSSQVPSLREAAGSQGPPPGMHLQRQEDKDMHDLFKLLGKRDHHEYFGARVPQPFSFILRDTQQRVICLKNNQLVAAPGAANVTAEEISVVPNRFLDSTNYPIILGVQGGTRCLSCRTSKDPVLQLENCSIMALYNSESGNLPFTFTNTQAGSTHRFESVACPGWFLCTSQGENEPLSITSSPGGTQITDFYFKKSKD